MLEPPCIPHSVVLSLNVSRDIGPNLQFNAINFGSPAAQSLTSYVELILGLLSADAQEICATEGLFC